MRKFSAALAASIAFVFALGIIFPAFPSSTAKELREAIGSISSVTMDTARLDNVALEAYEVFRQKMNFPPIEASAAMKFKGYDVSRLAEFANSLEKSPSREKEETAGTLIFAIGAIRQIHEASYGLSEEIFATGYQASASAFSFSAKLNRAAQNVPVGPALKTKICASAFGVIKGSINFISSYLPPEISRYVPICMWVGNELCSRSLGLPVSAPQTGARSFMVLTIGRVAFAFTKGIGFFPRTQRLVDDLGRAANGGGLPALTSAKKAFVEGELRKITAQSEKARQISANERKAAGLSQDLSELAGLVAAADPTRISGAAACAAGAISAGAYIHSFFGPLKKYNGLSGDMENILKSICETPDYAVGPPQPFEIGEEKKREIEEKRKRIKILMAEYVSACAELGEMSGGSGSQKEFFEKLKQVERLDYEIARLSLAK